MHRRALGIVLACTSVACSYPEFGFVPDDAATGDAGPLDDSSIVDSGARPDTSLDSAGSDTAAADTTAPLDGVVADTRTSDTTAIDTAKTDTTTPTDTTPPADTTPLGFCASASPAHFFCNDFDASSDPLFGWTSYNLADVGAYALDSVALSSPNSLHAQFTADDATTGAAASVNRNLDAPAIGSLTRFEADVRLDSATYSGDGTLLLKMQRAGGNGIGFGIDAGGFYLEMVGMTYNFHRVTATPKAGSWFHVRIEGTLLITGGSAKVWIDGVLVGSATGESTARDEGTLRNFVVGLYGDPAIVTFGARYDNAVVDFP